MSALVQLTDISKTFRRGTTEIPVLQNLSLEVERGEFVALMGPSGSGKSTLLNLLAGLDRPTRGSVCIDGQDLTHFSEGRLATWRARQVGFIFQLYNLIPVLTAFENVELPLLLTSLPRKERKAHVLSALQIVGLVDRANHYPRQLSGGQEQRVAIARAIVTDPLLLLADEPTGDLDAISAEETMSLLAELNQDHQKTIVMVTHDSHASARAKRTIHLEKGKLLPARPEEQFA